MVSVRVAAAGAPSQEGLPVAERKGVLWDAMRALQKQGWEPDTYSYSTSFRRGGLGSCLKLPPWRPDRTELRTCWRCRGACAVRAD